MTKKQKLINNYQLMFDKSPEGLFLTDLMGNYLLVNEQFCLLTGYTKNELLNMNVRSTHLESEFDLYAKRLRMIKEQKDLLFGRTILRKDGSTVYVQINLKIIEGAYIFGAAHKSRASRGVLKQLQDNEEKFRQITEHIRDVFFLIDLSGNFLYVSPAYELIWQKKVQDLIVNPVEWIDSIHKDDKSRIETQYQNHLRTGCLDEIFRIIQNKGRIRWIHAKTFPVYDNQHQLYRIAGIAEDITEGVLAEEHKARYHESIKQSLYKTVITLSKALEERDRYTANHQNNVAKIALFIAEELNEKNINRDCLDLACQVHDIGKISIPFEILAKPGRLTSLEFEVVKTHAQNGYDILKDIPFPWPVADIVLQHHERLNGSGYPRGLKANDILWETKILSVADTVDAMSSHRPYRAALGIEAAMNELDKNKGILYDEAVVEACKRALYNIIKLLSAENKMPPPAC